MKRIIIVAYNVHTGGGKTLLFSLLKKIPKNIEFILYADNRLKDELSIFNLNIKYVNNNIFSRFIAEINLRFAANSDDITLMFGGLPPIFKNKSHVYLFIQNLNNILNTALDEYSFSKFLRIKIERIWLRLFICNTQSCIVQTGNVKNILINSKLVTENILVLPFAERICLEPLTIPDEILKLFKTNYPIFIYPASNDAHKNHIVLLRAWELLMNEKIEAKLFLTLSDSEYDKMINIIPITLKSNIFNLGVLRHELLLCLCKKSNCMIFPSKYESFGLPLIEAASLKLPIIAPELDYVREVCFPVETFDPLSPLSIARAVKRFLHIDQSPLIISDPGDFLNFLVSNSVQPIK